MFKFTKQDGITFLLGFIGAVSVPVIEVLTTIQQNDPASLELDEIGKGLVSGVLSAGGRYVVTYLFQKFGGK